MGQSVGMLGGTPRHALWFYAADESSVSPHDDQQDCGGLYGLDPHTVQAAPRGTKIMRTDTGINNDDERVELDYRWQVQLTDSYLRSLHISTTTTHPNHHKPIP